jgi:hypothetical protein
VIPVEDPAAIPAAARQGKGRIAAPVCVLVSIALIRSGVMTFFFLIPLGYMAAAYGGRIARRVLIGIIAINTLISLGLCLFFKAPVFAQLLDILYHTVMYLAFFWIMAPPEGGGSVFRIRTAYRLTVAGIAGALTFLFIMYVSFDTGGFSALVRSQAEMLSSMFAASSGADAARRSFVERYVTPEWVINVVKLGALRGGAVASCLVMFFMSRQIAQSLAWIIRRVRPLGSQSGSLRGFHAPHYTIWILSFSLAAILLSRLLGIALMETLSWNVLILCTVFFLAQGGGIILYALSRRSLPPLMRFLFNVLVIVMIFSPGINALALGALVLLGIAENWVPFRAPKSDGPSSTPGM